MVPIWNPTALFETVEHFNVLVESGAIRSIAMVGVTEDGTTVLSFDTGPKGRRKLLGLVGASSVLHERLKQAYMG